VKQDSICGADCKACAWSTDCGGCAETNGQPFGKPCIAAGYCRNGKQALEDFKKELAEAFNRLHIEGMGEVTNFNALKGSFINLEYRLPSGQAVRFWEDDKIYFGNQLCKKGSDRCYGLAADEKYLLVCEYGDNGADAEIVVFKRWN